MRLAVSALVMCAPMLVCGADEPAAEQPGQTTKAPEKNTVDFSLPEESVSKPNFPTRPKTIDNLFRDTGPFLPPPAPAPRPAPAPPNRQLLDQKNNWVFITPEDTLESARESAKPAYLPDGRERSSLSAVERYYERLSRERMERNASFGNSGQESSAGLTTDAFGAGNSAFMVPGSTGTPVARPNTAAEFFGAGPSANSPEALRLRQAQREHLEEFKRIIGLESRPTLPGPFDAFGVTSANEPARASGGSSPVPGGNTPASLQGSLQNPYAPQPPNGNAAFNVTVPGGSRPYEPFPSASAYPTAPGQPNGLNTPAAPSSRTPQPKADFSMPQRGF